MPSDYRDYFIDGPWVDPDMRDAFSLPHRRVLGNGRARLTVTMTKAQKRMYLELGGAPWLKKVLSQALKSKETTKAEAPSAKTSGD
jgi:hypothetical protein